MYVNQFFDNKPHNIKLKNWDRNYISIQITESNKMKISFWDNNKFEWSDYTFTIKDLTNPNWEEVEI